jgi:hypothetical protein
MVFGDRVPGGRRTRPEKAAQVAEPEALPEHATLLPLDTLLRQADVALPGGQLRRVTFPAKPGAPLVVRKRFAGELHPIEKAREASETGVP